MVDSSASLAQLSGSQRKRLEQALLPNERVLGVFSCRESKALVHTDGRMLIVKGGLMGGSDSVQLNQIAGISSGLYGISFALRNGNEVELTFWPQNRGLAKDFVKGFHEHQARLNRPRQPQPQVDVADQLQKLAQLRSDGILSDEEFQAQKAKLLG